MKHEKIEGIVLSKIPHRDRDLICHLLLRSGKKVAVVFYGGQGGGKRKKSSLIELGFLLEVQLQRRKNEQQTLFHAKEYKQKWYHETIRLDHRRYYLTCFFLEFIEKIAVEDDLDEHISEEGQIGLFRILSNAIFHLEKDQVQTQKEKHLSLFLAKLIFELGLTPNLRSCIFTDKPLQEVGEIQLVFEQGGFAFSAQFERNQRLDHRDAWQTLVLAWDLSYAEFDRIQVEKTTATTLMHYLLYQTGISSDQLKTYSSIF